MKIFIKNEKALDGLLLNLEGKLEIMKDDMPDRPDTEDLESIVIPDIRALKTPVVFDTASVPNLMGDYVDCLLYTSPSPRDRQKSRMPSSA